MGKKSIIVLLGCVVALSLALVGCANNSSANSSAAAKQALVGTWDLVEIVQDGQPASKDELETIKGLGLDIFLNLNEDGTAALVLFGEVQEGTWEVTSSTAGKLVLADHAIEMTIDNSQLKFEQAGTALTFAKGEKKEVPTASSGANANAGSSANASSSAEGSSSSAN